MAVVNILGQTGGGETLKYASGTAQYVNLSQLLTVNNVGFRPYAVYFEYQGQPSGGMGIGMCNTQGTVVRALFFAPMMGMLDPADFTPNDNGFTFQAEFYGDSTITWYAIGK